MHLIIKFSLFCFVLFGFVAQAVMPELEAYGKLESVSDMSISPNGELIAYRLTKSDKEDHIVVLSLIERKVIAAVDVKKIDPQGHYFVNNDFLVLIGSNHVKLRNYRNSFDASTPYSFDLKTKKVEPLIKLGELIGKKRIKLGQSGLGRVAGRSPDGKTLFIPAYIEADGINNESKYSLVSVDITGKGRPKIAVNGTSDTRRFFLDDQGNVLAREKLNNKTNAHSIDIRENKKWRTIYEHKSKTKSHSFKGLDDKYSGIVFSRDDDDDGYLFLSFADGSVKELDKLNREKGSKGVVRNEHRVVIGTKSGGFSPIYKLLDDKLNQRVKNITAQFPGQSAHVVDWTPDWKHIVVRVEGPLYVGDYLLFSEGKKPAQITSSRLNIKHDQINPVLTKEYKSRDGLTIPTLLTFPREQAQKPENLPTVVMPHGGPASQDRLGFNYRAQALASRGFLVIQPQFRGSTGFGKDLYEAGWGEWGKSMQNDLTDAVVAFSKKGVVDPERVCIVGGSYGGYAALAGVAFTPDVYKCAVSINGVSHLPQMLSSDKKRYGKKSWVLDYWNRSILNSDFDKNLLKEISPYFSAEKIKAPVLLIHGEDDKVVEFNQSKLMQKAIKKQKGQVKLVKLKNDDHYLQDSDTRVQALIETVKFVEQHIGAK